MSGRWSSRKEYFIGCSTDSKEKHLDQPLSRKGEKMNRIIKKASRVWKTAVLVTAFLAGTIGSIPAGEVAEVLPINPVPPVTNTFILTLYSAIFFNKTWFFDRPEWISHFKR